MSEAPNSGYAQGTYGTAGPGGEDVIVESGTEETGTEPLAEPDPNPDLPEAPDEPVEEGSGEDAVEEK